MTVRALTNIQAGSVRENIVFGQPLDEARYRIII